MANFEIYQDEQGDFRWRFQASNGKTLALSEEGFHNRLNCEHSIILLKQQAPRASISVELSSTNQLKTESLAPKAYSFIYRIETMKLERSDSTNFMVSKTGRL